MTPNANDLVADGLATAAEAAEFLSLSRSWVYSAMDRGELPYCRFGTGRCAARRIPWRVLRAFAAGSLTGGWNVPPNSMICFEWVPSCRLWRWQR